MALIDSSYFVGAINIPNTAKTEISERLTWFINKYEPRILTDILGYELYGAFKVGLQEGTVAQKWLDLLYGVDFTYSSKLRRFKGLVSVDDALNPGSYFPDDIFFTADSTNVSTGEYHLPFLAGKTFRVVQRGVGPLEDGVDIVIVSDGFEKSFELGEKFTIEFTGSTPLPDSATIVTSIAKESLIANYVYWMWIHDQQTQTVGLGEVAAKAENADAANPSEKLMLAWNEMVDDVENLYLFLQQSQTVYPEWNTGQNKYAVRRNFQRVNLWGI